MVDAEGGEENFVFSDKSVTNMENSSTNGEDSTEDGKHTPPYIVGSSVR